MSDDTEFSIRVVYASKIDENNEVVKGVLASHAYCIQHHQDLDVYFYRLRYYMHEISDICDLPDMPKNAQELMRVIRLIRELANDLEIVHGRCGESVNAPKYS